MDGHVQTGLVMAASVAEYDRNRIRKHEFTRPDKEDDRVRQIEALNAQTGPVLLAYPDAPAVDALLAQGLGPFDAACAGAWMHGDAGKRVGPGLTAEDLDEALRETLRTLYEAR
jgi:hypothetical protein